MGERQELAPGVFLVDGRIVMEEQAQPAAPPGVEPRQDSGPSLFGFRNPGPGNTPINAEDAAGILRVLGLIAGTVPQLGPLKLLGKAILPARMASGALTGGVASLLETGDPKEAGWDALSEGALEALAGPGGRAFHKGATNIGLRVGGIKGDVNKAAEAFVRQSELGKGGPVSALLAGDWQDAAKRLGGKNDNSRAILPGQADKTQARLARTGAELERVERSAVTRTPHSQLRGFNQRQMHKVEEGATNPVNTHNELNRLEADEVAQHHTMSLGPHFRWLADRFKNDPSFLALSNQDSLKLMLQGLNDPTMSLRYMGNIKRDAATKGREIIKSRMGHTFIPPSDELRLQSLANESQHIKGLYDEIDNMEGLGLKDINQDMSDLLNIKEVNEALRGGGGIMTDLGQFGIRGGVASGLSGNLARLGGGSPVWQALAGVTGPLGFNPKFISGLGATGASFLRWNPTLQRYEAIVDEEER